MSKPKLIVHAGLPKCATSSLQNLLVPTNGKFLEEMGLTWLGRGFVPNAPGVPVSEIMYDRQAVSQRLRSNHYDVEKSYFVTSEALFGAHDVLAQLTEVFEVQKIILTVRMPALSALSWYCFSGWMTFPPEHLSFEDHHDKIERRITALQDFAPILLCPIEAPALASRFVGCFSTSVSDQLEVRMAKIGSRNRSISPALAIWMHRALVEHGIGKVKGKSRSKFTQIAKQFRGRPRFDSLMPGPFRDFFTDTEKVELAMARYQGFLRSFAIAEEVIQAVSESCGEKLRSYAEMEDVPDRLAKALSYRANWNIAHVQHLHPEILPKSLVDLSHYHQDMKQVLGEVI